VYIGIQDLRFCLDKASELSELYHMHVLGTPHSKKSIDDLVWVCTTYLQKNITLQELDASVTRKSINGFYVSYGTSYKIVLHSGMNLCWRRFVLCKELFHVLIDAEPYRSMDISAHVEEVTSTFPVLESKPGQPAISEMMAEIAAMEFMFPYANRLQELANTPIAYIGIAEKYKIPQVFVEQYLSESYMQYLGAFTAFIRQAAPSAQ
jgi:Zn-dependent peptidase ImmA (M78 family)